MRNASRAAAPTGFAPACRERLPERAGLAGGDPECVVLGESAVSAPDQHLRSVPLCARLYRRIAQSGQPQSRQDPACIRSGHTDSGFAFQRNQVHVVHDDEMVQVGEDLVVLESLDLELEIVAVTAAVPGDRSPRGVFSPWGGGDGSLSLGWFTPHHKVALDAALRIERQIPRSRAGSQVLYHVSDHTAEPTEPVAALDGHAPKPAQIVKGRIQIEAPLFPAGARPIQEG